MHPRFQQPLFALLLSGVMSCIVSGIATLRSVGLTGEMPSLWMSAWWLSWAVAFPSILVLAPLVRRLVARLVRDNP